MSAFTGILPVATSCAPLCRSAVANGAAHVFSYTINAAEQPGSIAFPASSRSSSPSNPDEAPSKIVSCGSPSTAKSWRSRPTIVPSVPFFHEGQVEDPDQAAVDEIHEVGNASPVGCLSAGHSTTT